MAWCKMGFLIKPFLASFIFLYSTTLFAVPLKDDLMRIHATLIPKIMMMNYDFNKRLIDNTISIAIIYDNTEQKQEALALKRYLNAKYPGGFQNHKIKIVFLSYNKITFTQKHTLYYFLPTSKSQIKNVVAVAYKNKAFTFAYQEKDLQYGVMISVKISNKVKPILNIDALKATGISMRPILLKVAEIFFQPPS